MCDPTSVEDHFGMSAGEINNNTKSLPSPVNNLKTISSIGPGAFRAQPVLRSLHNRGPAELNHAWGNIGRATVAMMKYFMNSTTIAYFLVEVNSQSFVLHNWGLLQRHIDLTLSSLVPLSNVVLSPFAETAGPL